MTPRIRRKPITTPPTPPATRPWMKVPDDVMDKRVLTVLLVCVVEKRLTDGLKSVYGVEIEAAYRRRYRQPSTLVKPTLKRLQEAGKVQGPEKNRAGMDLYTIVKEKRV